MDIENRKEKNVKIFAVKGALDDPSAALLLDAVSDEVTGDDAIVVDMTLCTDVSCGGLRALLSVARQSAIRGAKAAAAGISDDVADVLETTSFCDLLPVFETVEDALAYIVTSGETVHADR